MKYFIVLVFTVFFGMWVTHEMGIVQDRQQIAESWGNTDAQYSTSGPLSTNLIISMTNPDTVDCDAIVSSTVTDKELSRQLKALGFKTLQCMNHTARLTR